MFTHAALHLLAMLLALRLYDKAFEPRFLQTSSDFFRAEGGRLIMDLAVGAGPRWMAGWHSPGQPWHCLGTQQPREKRRIKKKKGFFASPSSPFELTPGFPHLPLPLFFKHQCHSRASTWTTHQSA